MVVRARNVCGCGVMNATRMARRHVAEVVTGARQEPCGFRHCDGWTDHGNRSVVARIGRVLPTMPRLRRLTHSQVIHNSGIDTNVFVFEWN